MPYGLPLTLLKKKIDSNKLISLNDIYDAYSHTKSNEMLRKVFIDVYNMGVIKGVGKHLYNYVLDTEDRFTLFYFIDQRYKNLDPFILNEAWTSDPITTELEKIAFEAEEHYGFTILNDNVGMNISINVGKEHSILDPDNLQLHVSIFTYFKTDVIGTPRQLYECDLCNQEYVLRWSEFQFNRLIHILTRFYDQRGKETICTLPIFDIRGGEITKGVKSI